MITRFDRIFNILVSEGRIPRSEAYASFDIDPEKIKEALDSGVYDRVVESAFKSGWLGRHLSRRTNPEGLKGIIRKSVNGMIERSPESMSELKDVLESSLGGISNKTGTKGLVRKMVNAFLQTPGAINSNSQTQSEFKDLSDIEIKALHYIQAGGDTTAREDLASYLMQTYKQEPSTVISIIDNLQSTGYITVDGDILKVSDTDNISTSDTLDINDDDDIEVDPLDFDSSARNAYDELRRDKEEDWQNY